MSAKSSPRLPVHPEVSEYNDATTTNMVRRVREIGRFLNPISSLDSPVIRITVSMRTETAPANVTIVSRPTKVSP